MPEQTLKLFNAFRRHTTKPRRNCVSPPLQSHAMSQCPFTLFLGYWNYVRDLKSYQPLQASLIRSLDACFIIYSFLEDLKERAGNKDMENKPRTITPDIISQPTPVPNFKPATMSMGPGGYPISIIDGFGGMMPEAQGPGGVEQHTWDQVPLSKPHSNSPPTTPMVPSHPDYHTGMRPLRLAPRDGSASQPNSPHVIPPIEVSTSPIHPYGLGSAGLSTSYAFSAGNNSFGSRANTPTQAAYNTNSSGVDNRF